MTAFKTLKSGIAVPMEHDTFTAMKNNSKYLYDRYAAASRGTIYQWQATAPIKLSVTPDPNNYSTFIETPTIEFTAGRFYQFEYSMPEITLESYSGTSGSAPYVSSDFAPGNGANWQLVDSSLNTSWSFAAGSYAGWNGHTTYQILTTFSSTVLFRTYFGTFSTAAALTIQSSDAAPLTYYVRDIGAELDPWY